VLVGGVINEPVVDVEVWVAEVVLCVVVVCVPVADGVLEEGETFEPEDVRVDAVEDAVAPVVGVVATDGGVGEVAGGRELQ